MAVASEDQRDLPSGKPKPGLREVYAQREFPSNENTNYSSSEGPRQSNTPNARGNNTRQTTSTQHRRSGALGPSASPCLPYCASPAPSLNAHTARSLASPPSLHPFIPRPLTRKPWQQLPERHPRTAERPLQTRAPPPPSPPPASATPPQPRPIDRSHATRERRI